MGTQNRLRSPVFWLGLISTVYTAVIHAGVSAGVNMPWWVGAIGVGLSTVFVYFHGDTSSQKNKE